MKKINPIYFVLFFVFVFKITAFSAVSDIYVDTFVNGYVIKNMTENEILLYLDRKDTEKKLSDIELGAKYIWLINPPFDREILTQKQIGERWKYLSREEKNKLKIKWFKIYMNSIDLNDLKQYINIDSLIEKGKIEKENYNKRLSLVNDKLNSVNIAAEKPVATVKPKIVKQEIKEEEKESKIIVEQKVEKKVEVKKKPRRQKKSSKVKPEFKNPEPKLKDKLAEDAEKKASESGEFASDIKLKNVNTFDNSSKVKQGKEEPQKLDEGDILNKLNEKKTKLKKMMDEEKSSPKIDKASSLQKKLLDTDQKLTEEKIKEKENQKLNIRDKKKTNLPTTLSNE